MRIPNEIFPFLRGALSPISSIAEKQIKRSSAIHHGIKFIYQSNKEKVSHQKRSINCVRIYSRSKLESARANLKPSKNGVSNAS